MPPLAVSMGDPAGIGPEIIAESWRRRSELGRAPFFVVGCIKLFQSLLGESCEVIASPSDALSNFDRALPVLPIPQDFGPHTPGQPDENSARAALASLNSAIECVLRGEASGLVTGPIAKSNLYAIGFDTPGQTEYVSRRAGLPDETGVMMLAGPSLRVVPMTVHIPLADVPAALTAQCITHAVRTTYAALQTDFGIASPRLAVAGLNPHAGENGTIGDEERIVITPTLDRLRAEGMAIDGPLPADSLFHAEARARYDAVLCPAHDQALIPIKALHFDDAVNVTLGLPIIRTSPDHGTAFAIAGKGVAKADSMIAAIRLASEIAANRSA